MTASTKIHTRRAGLLAALGLAAALALPGAPAWSRDAPVSGRWIALFPGDREPILHRSSVPVWGREEGIVIAGLSQAQLDGLRAQGVLPLWSAPDHGEGIHVLSHDRSFAPPDLPGVVRFEIDERAMLYLLPAGLRMELPRQKLHALFHGVPRVALPPRRIHPADAADAADPAGRAEAP